MLRYATLICSVSVFCGCVADHQGYLLKTETGQKGSVIFHDQPNRKHGSVEALLANGEECRGQFNTVPDQVTRSWNDPSDVESEDTQVGVAVLKCADDHVVKCDFSREKAGRGSGRCSDNLGQKYSLNLP